MTNLDKIDQEITDILLEHLVLANDNGQPYIQYTDVAVDKIITLIATQIQEARLDELYEAIDVPIANLPSYLADRIAQLRSTPNDTDR